jgi:hypothetical protein
MRRLIPGALALLALAAPAAAQTQVKKTPGTESRVVALSRGLFRLTSIGDTAVLTARIFGEGFKPLAGVAIEWRSEDDAIAAAQPSGAVIAVNNGTTRVWAKAGTDSVFAVITVEQRAAKLAWNVGNPIVLDAIGASVAIRAEQRDAKGYQVKGDFPLTACTVKAEGTPAPVALAGGKLTARANGAATLACRRGTVKDDLKIVVRQEVFAARLVGGDSVSLAVAGDTTRVQVQAFDRLGKPIVDVRGTWATLTPDVVDVEPTTGTILGKAQGRGLVTAKIENAMDTIVVNVLAPLPEGKVLPVLAKVAPKPVPVVAAPSTAAPVSAGAAVVSAPAAGGAAAPAPAPSSVLPSAPRPAATSFVSTRGPVATFASAQGDAAADSAAIAKIIEAGVAGGGGAGRTFVITPMAAQAEYRVLVDSVGTVYTTGGTLVGAAATIGLFRNVTLDGHFLTGTLKATAGTVTNLYDGSFGDARVDLRYEALPGFFLSAGYGVRGIERLFYAEKEVWSMVRTGLEGRLGLFGDRLKLRFGATYFPSATDKGQATDAPGTMFGAHGGAVFRAGWFELGVNYEAQSVEFQKANLASQYQRQARFSTLGITLGGHWGR